MSRHSTPAVLLFMLTLLLAACGDDAAPAATPVATSVAAAQTATVPATATVAASPTPPPTPTMMPSPTPRPDGLLVEAQILTDEGAVRVTEVVSSVAGWVVVHADEAGAPGAVLGATAVPAGVSSSVMVTIDPLLATGRLFVTLHAEGEEANAFDPALDPPLRVAGEPLVVAVAVDLQISVPVLEVADQDIAARDGGAETRLVDIPAVTALAPGWVALYAAAEGGPGALLAFVAVPAGRTRDITLAVNRFNATPLLFAALHTDAGEIGRFEPDMDPLVAVGAEPLLVSFTVALPLDLLMLDQPIVDDQLVVSKVLVNERSWVAVYYDDEDGTSWIVGFGLLQAGINENVVIDLLTEPPVTELYLRLHVDREDPGVFEFPGADGPVLIDGRLPAPTPFITNPGNYLIARDQVAVDATITVPLIVVDLPIWVAIYGDADGARGPLLGRVQQPAGLLRDVVVTLDEAPVGPVYVAIHRDDGDALFEPDADDPVLLRNGAPIETPFMLLAR